MTNPSFVYVIMILDESGSMEHLTVETVSGFNKFLADQQALPGRCWLRLTQFSRAGVDQAESFRMRSGEIHAFPPLSAETYRPAGGTPLLDAVALTVRDVGLELDSLPEAERPGKVLLMINTDGEENASYNILALPLDNLSDPKASLKRAVNAMLKRQQEVYNWQVIYLGLGLDAWTHGGQATSMGVSAQNVSSSPATPAGVAQVFSVATRTTTESRTGTP